MLVKVVTVRNDVPMPQPVKGEVLVKVGDL